MRQDYPTYKSRLSDTFGVYFRLAALRNLPFCIIPLWRWRAAVLAGVGLLHVSREGALLGRQSFAQLLFRPADFGVSSYASVRSLLWRSPEISGTVVVRKVWFVALCCKGSANLTFEWDRPEAACPSILR